MNCKIFKLKKNKNNHNNNNKILLLLLFFLFLKFKPYYYVHFKKELPILILYKLFNLCIKKLRSIIMTQYKLPITTARLTFSITLILYTGLDLALSRYNIYISSNI